MNLDWGSYGVCPLGGVPVTKTALEAAPNPSSALFDNLSPYFGILYI